MDVSVVLGTYNRAESLRETLDSFSGLVCPPGLTWELLVVDNNSSDATAAVVRNFAHGAKFPVRYVFEKIQGRSAALNAGITEAHGEIIVFTDDDVFLDSAWLSNLKDTFDKSDCEAVAGRVVPVWNHPKPDWLEMNGQFAVVHFELGDHVKVIKEPPLGANSAFRKDVFRRHGAFRLDLGVRGTTHTITCDDTEFGERLIAVGEKIVYCPTAIVYHPVDPKRTTKRYFLSWYFYNGVSLTRTAGLPREQMAFLFGVPRWRFRELLAQLFRWLITTERKLRFQRKLRAWRIAGIITESYRLSRQTRDRRKPDQSVPNDALRDQSG
jgi:glucosyl-dolichyl phosphate glucuronosyltransferase